MPDEAFHWMGRIKAVEREFGAIRLGTDRLLIAVNNEPAILDGRLKRPDIASASLHLEGTYLIRVFAEYETALQRFIIAFHIRKPRSTEALINRVQDRARIPQEDTLKVHTVRDFRNSLIHERTSPVTPVTIREATKFLCSFLSRLQRIW